jgi:filamentous hemagglutinin
VQGVTDLKGGVIASSQSAIDGGKNSFDSKGGVTQTDLVNTAVFNANGSGFSAGGGTAANPGGPAINGLGAGVAEKSGSQTSVTKSGIGVATSVDTTAAIKPIFDAQKVTNDINAQVQITQAFSGQARQAVDNYLTTQKQALSAAAGKCAN